MSFDFMPLPYGYNALEPHIDSTTMEIHHSKHHKTYFEKFIGAIRGTALENKSLEVILAEAGKAGGPVRNNGGGFYNHNFFWKCLSPSGGKAPTGVLADAINNTFGSYDELKQKMNDAGVARFGSGFVWLIVNSTGKLEVCSTPNQDNPLMDVAEVKGKPIMAIDVWEHAYYLKYQNKRPDYLAAFWKVVNWDFASEQFKR